MVCEENETDVTIGIPAVMLPQDAGDSLEKDLNNNMSGMYVFNFYQFYNSQFLCVFLPLHFHFNQLLV